MECPASRLFHNALCKLSNQKWIDLQLTSKSVGQCYCHPLWICDILHKTFHPPTIPKDLRANQAREHVHVCRSSHLYLGLLHNVLGGNDI